MGSVIAAHYVNDRWGLSFVVPGVLLIALSFVVFLGLPASPTAKDPSGPPPEKPEQQHHPNKQQQQPQQQLPHASSTQQGQNYSAELDYVLVHTIDGAATDTASSPNPPTETLANSSTSLTSSSSSLSEAISFARALRIPGILNYSFALFFAKFVSYRCVKIEHESNQL